MLSQTDPGPAHPGPQAGMSIAEAARRTGVSAHTRATTNAGLVVTPSAAPAAADGARTKT
jgi:hypothetical protein